VTKRREDSDVWRWPVRLGRAVDLRDHAGPVGRALTSVPRFPHLDGPGWCLDQETSRDVAAWLRYEAGVDGLIVPSVAFLDDPSRGNIVVFTSGPDGATERLGTPRLVAAVRWSDRSPADANLDTRLQLPPVPSLVGV